jgi:hypothetical protein
MYAFRLQKYSDEDIKQSNEIARAQKSSGRNLMSQCLHLFLHLQVEIPTSLIFHLSEQ